jgi:H+-translocating NAD(P) transhydrogenase subunit alpha
MDFIVPVPFRWGNDKNEVWPKSLTYCPEYSASGYDWPSTSGVSPMDGFLALYVFMLAAFTGYEIIGRVPVILHTPLMSGSNFVHGIVLVGAMVVLGHADTTFEKIIGFIAVLMGAGNAAGGYVVTERMLEMFKSSKKEGGK